MDLISRWDVIDELQRWLYFPDYNKGERNVIACAIAMVEELPSAEQKGKWIEKAYGFFDSIPVCSECGCITKMRERYSFCPYCGARMVSE